jgi:hypothetical protein
VAILQLSFAAKTMRPFTLKTQMQVKEANPEHTHFMQISTNKNGQPVGIIVKRRVKAPKSEKRKQPEAPIEFSDEVLEIIGVRVPDTADDRRNVYRNAQIVNNKLIAKKAFNCSKGSRKSCR